MRNIIIMLLICTTTLSQQVEHIIPGMTGTQFKNTINNNFDKNTTLVDINNFYESSDNGDYSDAFDALIAYCSEYNKTAYFPSGTYYMSRTFNITTDFTIMADNATITTDIETGVFIKFTGSIGSYTTISRDIKKGQNYIVSSFNPNIDDLIKIRSDRPFGNIIGEGESIGCGEMAIVRNVNNGVIYLHSPLMDSYRSNTNLRVAKITPIKVSIIGNLTIKNTTTDYSSTTASVGGVSLIYCRDINVNLNIKNFSGRLISLTHCYSGSININGYGATRRSNQVGDGSPGYGVEVVGTTMNVSIYGVIAGCRHCITFNGSEGVAWNNKISITGYGTRGTAIVDSHYPCGNMIVDNCILIGGDSIINIENSLETADIDTIDKYSSQGIIFGARNVYITNTKIYNCAIGILPRNTFDTELLYVSNVLFDSCGTAISDKYFITDIECYIQNIVIDGCVMKNGGNFLTHNSDYYNGNQLSLKNINLINSDLLTVGTPTLTKTNKVNLIVSELTASNISGSLITTKDEFFKINIANAICSGYNDFILITSTDSLSQLRLSNVDYAGNYLVRVTGNVAKYRFSLISASNICLTTTNTNIIHFSESGQTFNNLMYNTVYATGATTITNGTATTTKAGDIIYDNP